MGHGLVDGPKRFGAKVDKLAIGSSDSGHGRVAELLIPLHGGMVAVGTIINDAVRGDVATGPTCGQSAQVGIEQDGGIIADTDGEPFHRRVARRKLGVDAGPLEWEILLEKAFVDVLSMGSQQEGAGQEGAGSPDSGAWYSEHGD